jgi:hypothetical protein
MSNFLSFQIFLLFTFLLFNTTYVNGFYDEFLLEISKNIEIKKYAYFYENYDENFGTSLLDLKNRMKSIRIFFYEYNTNNSLSLYSYNLYCHLIYDEIKIAFYIQNFNILLKVYLV